MRYYAHSLENRPPSDWETMSEHEDLVATFCCKFLKRINPTLEPWGDLLGRWHDLGKYSDEFQNYLRFENELPFDDGVAVTSRDHATAGAQHAVEKFKQLGKLIAYVIAGHHAGLADADSAKGGSGLNQRLIKKIDSYENAPKELLELPQPNLPNLPFDSTCPERCAFQISMLCRMMFSALCDADFLATESFMSPERKSERDLRKRVPMSQLKQSLGLHLQRLAEKAEPTEVNQQRAEILRQCKDAAKLEPGIFSLTVPTGGGKTLSSLAFAVNHAIAHDLDRIIYAIPFTSIVEQTTSVFQDALKDLGDDVVLEHHSSIDPEKESRVARLVTENWDASLIVTTNVQLFESLFANKTSRCRKLHRIANSVIILDEAQTIPVDLLKPTLNAIRELVDLFGCTVVICTATQPAIAFREDFQIGLKNITEIVSKPEELFKKLRRVMHQSLGKVTDSELVEALSEHDSFLCIVNTRNHAARLFGMATSSAKESKSDIFHLSMSKGQQPRLRVTIYIFSIAIALIHHGDFMPKAQIKLALSAHRHILETVKDSQMGRMELRPSL